MDGSSVDSALESATLTYVWCQAPLVCQATSAATSTATVGTVRTKGGQYPELHGCAELRWEATTSGARGAVPQKLVRTLGRVGMRGQVAHKEDCGDEDRRAMAHGDAAQSR